MSKLFKALLCGAASALLTCLLATGVFAEGSKVGVINADALNVREAPSTSATVLSKLYTDDQVTILDTSDGWYKVSCGDTTGWVKSDYVSVGDGSSTATITGDSVNLRSEGSLDSQIVTRLSYGDKVSLLSQAGDWYYVKLSNGTVGWVFKDYITIGNVSRGDSLGKRITALAQKYIGVRYVYGGSSTGGFDCSGFVKYVYNNVGLSVERVAADQARQGTYVSQANLRVGDLVFFDTDGGRNYINHVGIYLGNGQFVHASSGSGRVMISSLWESFYASSYMTGRTFTR